MTGDWPGSHEAEAREGRAAELQPVSASPTTRVYTQSGPAPLVSTQDEGLAGQVPASGLSVLEQAVLVWPGRGRERLEQAAVPGSGQPRGID